jgi:hypothetical protein
MVPRFFYGGWFKVLEKVFLRCHRIATVRAFENIFTLVYEHLCDCQHLAIMDVYKSVAYLVFEWAKGRSLLKQLK